MTDHDHAAIRRITEAQLCLEKLRLPQKQSAVMVRAVTLLDQALDHLYTPDAQLQAHALEIPPRGETPWESLLIDAPREACPHCKENGVAVWRDLLQEVRRCYSCGRTEDRHRSR
jgi:hypothetical protein